MFALLLFGSMATALGTSPWGTVAPLLPTNGFEQRFVGESNLTASRAECIVEEAEHYDQTMIAGGERDTVVMFSRPLFSMEEFCCGLTNPGYHYTIVDTGPTPSNPDYNDYICSVWVQKDPNVPISFIPGNESTSAGLKVGKPPTPETDPLCETHETFDSCLSARISNPIHPKDTSCTWWEDACHYEPPIECGLYTTGPFCIGIAVVEQPYGGGEPGAVMNSFNWTSGTISAPVLCTVVDPVQVIDLGESTWWSVDNDPAGWEICVTYNEIFPDGASSDPNSGFSACTSVTVMGGGAGIGMSSGSTPNIDVARMFGAHSGWTSDGFDQTKVGTIWTQFVFWSSNTTTATL